MTPSMIVLIVVFVMLTMARIPIGIGMLAGGLAYLLHKGMDTGAAAEHVLMLPYCRRFDDFNVAVRMSMLYYTFGTSKILAAWGRW